MISIQNLREERAAKQAEVRNLLDTTKGQAWTAENQAAYDAGLADIDRLDGEIERYQNLMERVAKDRVDSAIIEAANRLERDGRDSPQAKVFAKFLRQGVENLSEDDLAIVGEGFHEGVGGFLGNGIRNTMSTGVGAEGGYTVQSDVAPYVFEALAAFGGVRKVATVLRTEAGNPLSYPTSDGTSEEGEQLDENSPGTDADPSFGTVPLNTYLFSSKVVTVPLTLLADSSIDIEAWVGGRLSTRLGRITNRRYTTGTGVGQARGVVTAAGAGKVGAAGQTTTVIYDDLVDLQHSVDPAYRELGCHFMMHDGSLKVIRKIKDNDGRPIFTPSYDKGGTDGAPALILGDPVVINQHMATMAANAKSILYGHFKHYVVRDVLQMAMFRYADSAFLKKFCVGFHAWARSGGNYCDVGGGLKYYQNAAA